MPDETSALEPPHKYVPWVVVNGEPLYEDYENFLSYLCKAYKGTATPQSCTQASYLREVNAKPKHSVCYKDSAWDANTGKSELNHCIMDALDEPWWCSLDLPMLHVEAVCLCYLV
ncbi:Gamma-interferon-inducible lysosomal thiol reductase [Glycine soja]|uniref:Gamma-interferon-inducible lysosomal thiol reductase n=1 Tax=Glycine soja TaxID=3848 RepID=A0A0B2NY76_GLYSO|nr:hypothetical protein JHK86_049349 [Glycine max]KAG4923606.1 hypothetical protein JHK87_049146 [Glycine soja]KHN02101.1 Gamma-interferon-inducible lysosomal thiol reductase [Glycine soja]